MTWTLPDDRRAYKWARRREAEILQDLARLRQGLSRTTNPVMRQMGRDAIRYNRVALSQWRTRAASLETSDHLGLPL